MDNVENRIILSPEGPNFEGRPREIYRLLYDTVFWTWTIDTPGVWNIHCIEHGEKCEKSIFSNPTGPDFVDFSHMAGMAVF